MRNRFSPGSGHKVFRFSPGKFSPLRYPGGKGKLAPFIKQIIDKNSLGDGVYVEPYAGGAGVAVELLLQNYVSRIHINDLSLPIWSFWHSVLNDSEKLIRKIERTQVTVATWDIEKRKLLSARRVSPLELGFAALFVNRTSRSGIFNGGMIGGREQSGTWKIDVRFNKESLCCKIRSIARAADRVRLTRLDCKTLLARKIRNWGERTLIYCDPPYYAKGHSLYLNYYLHNDHQLIAKLLTSQEPVVKWAVSYDNVEPIREMYRGFRAVEYGLSYSAREAKVGSEIMFLSDGLAIPPATSHMICARQFEN